MELLHVYIVFTIAVLNNWIALGDDTLPDICKMEVDSGPCEALGIRWHFNPATGECNEFQYGGCKGNANNFDSQASCEKACKLKCGIQMCMMQCAAGFKVDEKGCDMCECNPEEADSECGDMMCMIECTNGFKLDDRGCRMCACNPENGDEKKECGNEMCMVECPNGFKLDERGCQMCECNPEETEEKPDCGNLMCMIECPNGLKKDEKGCDTCECNPEECGLNMCMIECPNGFKKDAKGCNLCECRPEIELYTTDKCETMECDSPMECRVFELTASRHQVARCVDPTKSDSCQAPMDAGPCKAQKPRWYFNTQRMACEEFSFGGCRGNTNNYRDEATCISSCIDENGELEDKECGNLMCMIECEAGFKKDSRGCNLCECVEVCPNQSICGLSCAHGYKKDDKGCQVCECLEKPPCMKNIGCTMECIYGFVVTKDGCQLCECRKEPCASKTCGPEETCKNKKKNGTWTGECISLHESKPWCGLEMCAMYCEHGFSTDQYGCDKCKCRSSPPACTLQECDVNCPFGQRYDSNGCRICECLPSPCQLDTCPMTKACEVKPLGECTSCPATFSCIDHAEVKRVRVSLEYFIDHSDELDEEDLTKLRKEFQAQLSSLLGIKGDILKGLQVQHPAEASISVSFHLVSFSGNNLVELYENFKEKVTEHTDNSQVHYADHTLIPEHATLAAQYHSDMEVPEEELWEVSDDDEDADDMTQTVTIVAAAVGGFIALLVIVVILVAIIRSKTKHKGQYQKHKGQKSVIYKKAPSSEQA